jgi:hypothetical protein
MAREPATAGDGGGLSIAARRLLGILLYYVLVAVALVLAWEHWPPARQLLAGASATDLIATPRDVFSQARVFTPAGAVSSDAAWQLAATTLFVLGGALIAALPMAWVYSLTRRRKGFEQSMVHILVLLPLAVAGMVILIQNSLALAFSLAGIVAVLRFRNTLDDVKDGVYVFIVVSIGISAAIGALTVGLVTSALFNVCVLVLWWLDFARRPTPGVRGGLRDLARLPKVIPARAPAPLREGDARTGDEVFASAARAWRRQLQLTAEHRIATPEARFNASLHVHTMAPDQARPQIEELLRSRARRWELTGIVPDDGGAFTLKYKLRLRRSARGELLDAARATSQTVGVELR